MIFNLNDMRELMGEQKARTRFIALRRANLGFTKTITVKGGNRYGTTDCILSMIHFDPNGVSSVFYDKIKEAKNNAFRAPNKKHLDAYNAMIDLANYFMEKK